MNREETPSSQQPSLSQPTNTTDAHSPPRFLSQPSTSSILPQQPPSKKFKADSQTRIQQRRPDNAASDLEVEKDVRAMDDEADKLRRLSRARTTIDTSLLQSNVRFPDTSRKGKSKAVDTLVPLTELETPTIQRNKQMRAGAMASIANGSDQKGRETGSMTPHGSRRKSSVSGRGKRVSTSFEATGIISKILIYAVSLICLILSLKRNHIIRFRRVVFISTLMLIFRTANAYVSCLSGALYGRFLGTRRRNQGIYPY